MKIAFLGNVNNFPFVLARAFKSLGHDVIFLVNSVNRLDRPEHKYPSITLPYPEWILDVGELPISLRPRILLKWVRVWWTLRTADIVVLNAFGIRLGLFLRARVLVILTGSDIELYAKKDFRYAPPKGLTLPKQWLGQVYHWISIRLMRTGIKRATLIWTAKKGLLPVTDAELEMLHINDEQRVYGFLVDVEDCGHTPLPSETTQVRIFNAARFVWHEPLPQGMTVAENKRNDILIKGLALLFKEYPDLEIDIVFVRKGVELAHTYALIESLGLGGRVRWIDELSQKEFYDQVRMADIVTDQFGNHAVSMAGYEAMQLGRPVVANGRLDEIENIYGMRPPVVEAKTPEEVRNKLAFLIFNASERLAIGRRSREFVRAHFSPKVRAEEVLEKFTLLRSRGKGQQAAREHTV